MKFNAKDLEVYKTLTSEQVRFMESMNAVRNKNRLVITAIIIVFILLGAGLCFLFMGKTVEGGGCLAADTIFGVIGHRVYNHYFPSKQRAARASKA